MFSYSVEIGAPVVGFVLGLVATYGLADAGIGSLPAEILQDQLVLRMSIGSDTQVGDERFISFDARFAGDRDTKKSLAEEGYRIASLGARVDSKVLVDAGSVFSPLSSDDILFAKPSDSFAERFSGAQIQVAAASFVRLPESSWVVQLIGDDSEAIALSRFRQLQSKHKAILGIYTPLVVNTALTPGTPPIWTRVRVGLDSRGAAESLCKKLESAGERCVLQRNTTVPSNT